MMKHALSLILLLLFAFDAKGRHNLLEFAKDALGGIVVALIMSGAAYGLLSAFPSIDKYLHF